MWGHQKYDQKKKKKITEEGKYDWHWSKLTFKSYHLVVFYNLQPIASKALRERFYHRVMMREPSGKFCDSQTRAAVEAEGGMKHRGWGNEWWCWTAAGFKDYPFDALKVNIPFSKIKSSLMLLSRKRDFILRQSWKCQKCKRI